MTPNSATSRNDGQPGCVDVMSTSATASVPAVTPAGHSRLAGQAPGWSLAAALLGFFMVTLDAVIVNVALPELLSSGSLSDRIGARPAFGA